MSDRAHTAERFHGPAYSGWARLVLIAVAAFGAAFLAWFLFKDDGKNSAPTRAPASAVTASELRALPGKVGHSVFWAGQESGHTLELTQTDQGNIYLRYLPAGVQPGDRRPEFLTVGTYPHGDAFGVLRKVAKNPGSHLRQVPGGGIAVYSEQKANSVFVAYPDKDLEIEIFDPSPSRALKLAVSGRVRSLG